MPLKSDITKLAGKSEIYCVKGFKPSGDIYLFYTYVGKNKVVGATNNLKDAENPMTATYTGKSYEDLAKFTSSLDLLGSQSIKFYVKD